MPIFQLLLSFPAKIPSAVPSDCIPVLSTHKTLHSPLFDTTIRYLTARIPDFTRGVFVALNDNTKYKTLLFDIS